MDKTIYHKSFRLNEILIKGIIYLCTFFAASLIFIIIGYVFSKALPHFEMSYLTQVHSSLRGTEGILGNIINTLYIIGTTLVIACPLGIGSAIYLNEYAKNKTFVRAITFTTEVLAGIPSIIFGLFCFIVFNQYFEIGRAHV